MEARKVLVVCHAARDAFCHSERSEESVSALDRILRFAQNDILHQMAHDAPLERPSDLTWDYDEEADVLYMSVGQPRPSVGVDIGEGVIVRYDDANHEVMGLTLIGVRDRLFKCIQTAR